MSGFRIAGQVFLRLLLAGAALLAAVQFFRLLLLPAFQHAFHPSEAATSLVRRIGILGFALLAYWAYVRLIEKRPVLELRPKPLAFVAGALSGALLIALAMGLLYASGVYEATAYRGWQPGLWGVAGLIFIAALLEEIAFRGIVFRILESGWGTMPALWLQSLLFAFVHIANVEGRADTQQLFTTVVSGVLVGAFWTLVFVLSRNLWVTAANHAAWNFTIILAGLPLSGLGDWQGLALFASEYRGPPWLTGGVFGPEDSVVTMTLVAASLVLLLRRAKAKQRLVATRAGLPGVTSIGPGHPHREGTEP